MPTFFNYLVKLYFFDTWYDFLSTAAKKYTAKKLGF
nr:MAG TPA: hypothetical protein [Caudoviricetes sp.]